MQWSGKRGGSECGRGREGEEWRAIAPFGEGGVSAAMPGLQSVCEAQLPAAKGGQLIHSSLVRDTMAPSPLHLCPSLFCLLPLSSAPLSLSAVFAPFAVPGANLLAAKLQYVLINLVGVGLLLWRIKTMGLLPFTSADWVSMLPNHIAATEFSSIGAPFT